MPRPDNKTNGEWTIQELKAVCSVKGATVSCQGGAHVSLLQCMDCERLFAVGPGETISCWRYRPLPATPRLATGSGVIKMPVPDDD